ncbi:hypothetical protein [Saliterribacillus persicus]|uniref:Type II secretory pathway pseudopilin PulG n=1 Tax=Saliterribacillus persicus TaxID=930114 RepID=A0A368XEI9_9BACI|nr:hypothetical protein [Saliterribacillus persicus]RCW66391.1 hypothetical protein DFR57_109112 [Saliterribacillus persicus]
MMKNQNGYALLIVLLSITIIMLLIPPILVNILNATTQYKKTEELIQLEKMEVMGITFVEHAIEAASNTALENLEEWMENQSSSVLENNAAIISRYEVELEAELATYGLNPQHEIILDPAKFRFKMEIKEIDIEDSTIILSYDITPSATGQYHDENVISEDQTVDLEIVE